MSRQGSHSLELDSPPSQTRLAYPLVPHPSASMHDAHLDYQSDRYSVEPYGMVPTSSAASPPYDYAMGGSGAVRPKRKQVKNACSACQRACKRCDVGRPCERCVKYGMQDTCRDSMRKERKKGVKRGPYKKRDGESAVPAPRSVADVAPPGMLNELQRMHMPTKTRTSRVSSISEPPSQASTSALDHATPAAVPLYIQPVSSARPSEGSFPYSTAVMIPAPTQHPSLASMHPSSSHPNMQHSTRGEDQYYQPRYDHLAHGSASTRPSPGHYRMDSYPVQQQEYETKQQVAQMVDHRSMRALQYPAAEESPPRERQYSAQVYNDNSHRHSMIQASPAHHDVSYHPQTDPVHESPRTIDAQYSYTTQQQQQHQRSYERTYQDRSTYQERPAYQERSYSERSYQDRSYTNEAHMQETPVQQEIQQPQPQQQQQYYSSYNNYQNQPSSSYASQSHSYGYPQNHASHSMAPTQHVSDQTDSGYMNRAAPDQVSYGSSINSYPTQQPQSYPSQHSMSGAVEYPMRSNRQMMQRNMVAHPHVGNVQIQSN